MDKLEQAMQSEDFWIELADTSFGKVILHGKNTNSIADNEYYEVSSEINTDGDFAITFFKTYEKMKKWFDDWQGEGFYNYLVELYEKQEYALSEKMYLSWNTKQIIDACIIQSTGKTGEILKKPVHTKGE